MSPGVPSDPRSNAAGTTPLPPVQEAFSSQPSSSEHNRRHLIQTRSVLLHLSLSQCRTQTHNCVSRSLHPPEELVAFMAPSSSPSHVAKGCLLVATCLRTAFRTLIVAFGGMLPREVETKIQLMHFQDILEDASFPVFPFKRVGCLEWANSDVFWLLLKDGQCLSCFAGVGRGAFRGLAAGHWDCLSP